MERLTWSEIVNKYPFHYVGLVDVDHGKFPLGVESAVVKYTDIDTSYDDLTLKAFRGEIFLLYTTPSTNFVEGRIMTAL